MAEAATDPVPPRRGRLSLILGAVAALAAGGGGFYAVHSGFLFDLLPERGGDASSLGDAAFITLEPMVISLTAASGHRHLRFGAALEAPKRHKAEVERLMPRILDVLNGYLRALDPQEFSRPGALIRLRAQMLRRIQIVAGEGRVRDLLVTEFVLN